MYPTNMAGLCLYLCAGWLRSRTAQWQMATAEHKPFVQTVHQKTQKQKKQKNSERTRQLDLEGVY